MIDMMSISATHIRDAHDAQADCASTPVQSCQKGSIEMATGCGHSTMHEMKRSPDGIVNY